MASDTRPTADHQSERVLLARARRGDLEALRGLVHRYASLVWAACAQVTADEGEAARRFGECWGAVLRSLGTARRAPDLAGMILRQCQGPLLQVAGEERVARAVASARQLAAEGSDYLEAPTAALLVVTDSLAEHAERLERETAERRARRQHSVVLPVALGLAVLVGAVAAFVTVRRSSTEDFLARQLRERVIATDLLPQFRDVVTPPFEAVERQAPEAREYEEISLVLEELVNMPDEVNAEQMGRLQRRVRGLDLVDFAAHEAERLPGGNRMVMDEVCLVLEEITNL